MNQNEAGKTRDVLHKKLTLTGWMHNRKALIAVSVLIAVVLWVVVMTDSTTARQRSISLPVSVDLTGSYASQIDLRLVEEVQTDVTVVVEGPWSTISAITAEDLQVRADVQSVQKAGKQTVKLIASRNSNADNYEIVSCTPSQLEIECDYWATTTVPLELDTSTLKVKDSKMMQLGTLLPEAGKDGKLTLSGPQSKIKRITKVVAPLTATEPLSDTTTLTPELKALDAKGAEVNLDSCQIGGLEGKTLSVNVPVNYYKDLTLSVEWHNAPKAISGNAKLPTITPQKVKAIGPKDALAGLGDSLVVTTFDFDHMVGKKYEQKVTLDLPEAVTLGGNVTEATVKLDLSGYKKKVVALTVSNANVTFTNNSAKKKTAVEEQKLNITIYGKEQALEKLDAKSLKVSVDLENTKEAGLKNATGTVSLPEGFDGWLYYGKDATGIPVSVMIS